MFSLEELKKKEEQYKGEKMKLEFKIKDSETKKEEIEVYFKKEGIDISDISKIKKDIESKLELQEKELQGILQELEGI